MSLGKSSELLEKSGTGKTTFVNILSGLLKPTEGEILIKDINNNKISFQNLIGYVPQTTFFNGYIYKRKYTALEIL